MKKRRKEDDEIEDDEEDEEEDDATVGFGCELKRSATKLRACKCFMSEFTASGIFSPPSAVN